MGETQKAFSHFEQALEKYQNLTTYDKTFFTPYVAASYNSLSILCSEMKNNHKAIAYCLETVAIYNDLADQFPEEYTHYLATSLHNLGLFYFEQKEVTSAEIYLNQALQIRIKLADKEPNAFNADVCATSLNLVELYQSELEKKIDLKYKKIGLELLQDVTKRLQKEKENRPVIKSMLSDCTYYLNYFNSITMEVLQLENAYKKTHKLTDEIHFTIHPEEKIIFQKEIVVLLEEQWSSFSENSKLKNNLADAYTNLSWMHLQLNQPKEAELTILKTQNNIEEFPSLLCNLGHSFLLQNRWNEAEKIYLNLIDKKNEVNKSYKHILLMDIEKLKNNGVKHPDFIKVKELFTLKK
jgi:tetratricopeptide (TPR) repeat protein